MIIKQLSIFLENKSGRLSEVLSVLGEAGISIKALTIADTSEYGILRMIVSDDAKALEALRNQGFSVNLTDVISIATPSEAGSFARILNIMAARKISVEYMYAFSFSQKAAIVMRPEDITRTIDLMKENGIDFITNNDLRHF
ncbi:MAG TPA: ACT domain-containing protein [Bacteroidales bacterium]|nr:ACT domain-containing protein [Bacteroidales bacterium]